MSERALRMAIVGHTNTGKTSLVRTLLRTRDFGEVADAGGTTRQIQGARLMADGRTAIELFDSPGLEAAGALLEHLESRSDQRHTGPERIEAFVADSAARTEFAGEAAVLELVRSVDVALYVIDAREPVLAKYLDELDILGQCARPMVAVLNFVAADSAREAEWREALARVRLHTVLAFDAAVRDPETEWRLFEKLRSQLDDFAPVLDAWLSRRRDEERARLHAACRLVADLLIDAAACVREIRTDDQAARDGAVAELRAALRSREQACVDRLLELYRFERADYTDAELPLEAGRWSSDLFDLEALKHFGLRTGTWAGAGAGIGAAVDLATAGLSLGAGTVVGTLVGTGTGLVRNLGRSTLGRLRGVAPLTADDATLRRLAWRQLELIRALVRRGHASQSPVPASGDAGHDWQTARLPRPLRRARLAADLSTLNPGFDPGQPRRRELVEDLAEILAAELRPPK